MASLQDSQSTEKKTEVRGVFSSQEIRKVGTGTTTRKTVQKTFWFNEQHGDEIECQPINPNFIPSGPKRKITMDELIAKFSPEPEFYMNSVYPKMQEIKKSVDNADTHREKGENFAAEYEYSKVLKVDEENVRANFGIGLTYLERGDVGKAQNIFDRLIKLEGAYEPEQKHLFNEFGINLRKNKMNDQAVEYYQRALQLSPNDENLHMNVARALFETQNYGECIDHLAKSLEISPGHDHSLKFIAWLTQKNLVPDDKKQLVKDTIQNFSQKKPGQISTQAPKPATPAAPQTQTTQAQAASNPQQVAQAKPAQPTQPAQTQTQQTPQAAQAPKPATPAAPQAQASKPA